MVTRITGLLLATILLSYGLTFRAYAGDQLFPTQNKEIVDLIENGLGFEIGTSRDQTIKLLGTPRSTRVTPVENVYYDFNDEYTIYSWRGLEVTYYKHNHQKYGWDKPVYVKVTDNSWKLKHGIKIGMKESQVIGLFGNLCYIYEEEGIKYLVYELSGEGPAPEIVFAIHEGKLVSISWADLPD